YLALVLSIDAGKSKGEAKLTKVSRKGMSVIGEIRIELHLAVTKMKEGDRELEFEPPAKLVVKDNQVRAIDGSTTEAVRTGHLKMAGRASGVFQGQKISLELDVETEIHEQHSSEIDDPEARKMPVVSFPEPISWHEFTSKEGRFSAL